MLNFCKKPPEKEEKKIGGTVYVVASYFKDTGCTAADKVRRLIDLDTKDANMHRKV